MSTVTINGNTYQGNNIVISNGKVIVNGNDVTPNEKQIDIVVHGNIEYVTVDACNSLLVNGNSNNISTNSGDVSIMGNVQGSIQTMSGDVECSDISGSVSTMTGNIKHKKTVI